jgi:hypothetical protein
MARDRRVTHASGPVTGLAEHPHRDVLDAARGEFGEHVVAREEVTAAAVTGGGRCREP